jgi:uncharacterized protein DUF1592/uncharacterized protein DUF1588/uncharacterized protein DUF1587/uncharacterized protein DUF1595/uncharacterized protein DUF1585/cytochrome c
VPRTLLIRAGIALFFVFPLGAQQNQNHAANDSGADSRTVLNRYCVSCHNEKLKTAGLLLDTMDVAKVGEGAEVWEKVVRKLRTGAMPPAGVPRPDKAAYDTLAGSLEVALDAAAAAHPNPGAPTIHRLNRVEYSNAIHDLLAVNVDAESLLPADDSGRGFDNLADLLSVSPVLMERYMAAAGKIVTDAIGDPKASPVGEVYTVPDNLIQDERESEDLMFGSRGGTAIHHHFVADGDYVIKITLVRNDDGYIVGLGGLPHLLDVRLDGERIKTFPVGGERHGSTGPEHPRNGTFYRADADQVAYEFLADDALEVRFPAKAGERVVGVAFRKKTAEPEGLLENYPRPMDADIADWKGGDPAIDSVTISGPFDAKGLTDTPSRLKVFLCKPSVAATEEPCATKILSTLARRAYRRPVSDQDVEPLLKLYRAGKQDGGFESGIKLALQGILVSPEFLFRMERDPKGVAPGAAYAVSDTELASRLSFFLWSSIPDDELLNVAEQGKLRDRNVLQAQVRRMLADERSSALVTNFAAQWLYIRNMRSVSPDPEQFPEFDDNLREAFVKETELFVGSMIRDDRPVLDLLDADYTYVNERLALHYGIPNVYGANFRRVKVPDDNRRGLLGQGSILTVTSRANRTSPVLRGKWVLENILGTPPPPPPPNVPPLKETGDDVKKMTMRQRMEQHRNNPVCANCHARMDPIGFSLDTFDADGKFRTQEKGVPLDVSGALPDGTKFNGPVELRKVIESQPQQFVYTMTEKLLTYSLGREPEYFDAPALRSIVRDAAASDYRWSSIIMGIVNSTPFQMRRARSS